ncbi:tyrosine-type recombinase/integrase [Campylobacter hyointestinalis]|uniref:ATP synthase C chain n=1 Tax=Campylobacter hyointestinalis subsp. hyointestinalis TaxID=91352 RepID=A0A9W5AQ52_CAMHY|nr:site-specific integrase [Campylobacter hyointestinalis]CUU73874.1 ATP synthase C chain [Campylobacter hyointestinalis subsp. hyointestinalis]CUU81729.1 ATP synthase C chain [Campylobacter hyointestinalis subsp. hyointestinalis]
MKNTLKSQSLKNNPLQKNGETMKHAFIRGATVWVAGTIDGKRYRVSTGKKNDKYVLAWAEKHWDEIITSAILAKDKKEKKGLSETTFGEFAERWTQSYEGFVRKLTMEEYKADLRNKILPVFANECFSNITPMSLTKWQSDLKANLSAKRVNNIRSILSQILNAAVGEGLIDRNPFGVVKKLRNEKTTIAPLNLEEIKRVIDASEPKFANIVKIAVFTGMRTGELIALSWDKVDFDKNTIKIDKSTRNGVYGDPKTESSKRTIAMLPIVREALLELKQVSQSKWIVPNTKGEMMWCPKTLSDEWAKTLKKAGLSHRVFYQTRHTFASLMISKGEDPLWVSSTMGHADASMTFKRYAKNIDTGRQRAEFLNSIEL